jgi:hypothetical protein
VAKKKETTLTIDLKKVIREYYEELKRAYKTKELHPDRLHLHDDAKLIGTNEFFDGKKTIVKMFENFIHLIKDVDIQHQYFDHNSCCTLHVVTSIIPEIQIKSTDRMIVRDGCITEIYVYYDTRAWETLMHQLQTLTSTASFFQKEVT